MALIRAEQQGCRPISRVWDGIVETAADLQQLSAAQPGSGARDFGPGSLMFCLGDGKLYVKKEDLSWAEVTV